MRILEQIHKYSKIATVSNGPIIISALLIYFINGVSFSYGVGSIDVEVNLSPFGSTGGGGGIGDSLCEIVSWFTTGTVGKAIASLAVIFLGIGAFFGKVTWGMALMFAAGIFSIFGAGEIVNAITNGASYGC